MQFIVGSTTTNLTKENVEREGGEEACPRTKLQETSSTSKRTRLSPPECGLGDRSIRFHARKIKNILSVDEEILPVINKSYKKKEECE